MTFAPSVNRLDSLLKQDVINWDNVAHELMDEREKHQIDSFPRHPSWAISIDDFNPVVFLKKTMFFFKEIDFDKTVMVVAVPVIVGFSVVFLLATSSNLFFSLALCSVCLISSSIIARSIENARKYSQEREMILDIIICINWRWNKFCSETGRGDKNFMAYNVVGEHVHFRTNYNRINAEASKDFEEKLRALYYGPPPISG